MESIGMPAILDDSLEQVLQTTGCTVRKRGRDQHLLIIDYQDRRLAERVLGENGYNAHMTIIELLQLMELTESGIKWL